MKTAGMALTIFGGFFAFLGLLWVVVYYASSAMLPIPQIQNWNILIGAGLFIAGFTKIVVGIVLTVTTKNR
ncbi:MAG: cell division protein CrgA [Actinomycetales bacterium]|nr:cell division protein CrgA [Actinomycetales bacterium]